MALSDIKKSELGSEAISTRVKGWDVFIEQKGPRYYFSIFLCYDEDSDAAVTVVTQEYCYTITDLKAEIMQIIDDLPYTAKEAARLALSYDAGHTTIEGLETLARLDLETYVRDQLRKTDLSGLTMRDLARIARATEQGPVFFGVTLAGHDLPAILKPQNA